MARSKFNNSLVSAPAGYHVTARRFSRMWIRWLRQFQGILILSLLAAAVLVPARVRGQTDVVPITPAEFPTFERVLAAGDGVHLWFVRPRQPNDDSRFRVAHHLPEMGAGSANDALILPERPEALIAVNGALYCIFSPPGPTGKGSIARQIVRATVAQDELGRWRYESTARTGRIITPLPGFGTLLGTADDGREPLVLMRLAAPGSAGLASSGQTGNNDAKLISGALPGANESNNEVEPGTTEVEGTGVAELVSGATPVNLPAEQDASDWWTLEHLVDGLVLLRLGRGVWESVPFPADFPAEGASVRLLAGPRPVLVVRADAEGAAGFSRVYVLQNDDSWSTPFVVALAPEAIESAARVGGQTVVALAGAEGSVVQLQCLRPHELLEISVLPGRTSARALVTLPGALGLVDRAVGVDAVVLVRIDLATGEIIDETIMNAPIRLGREDFSALILMGALLITIVVIFLVRPDPTAMRIVLPAEMGLAEPRRRLAAAFLDLLPSAIVAGWLLGEPLAQLRYWPLFSKDIADSAPALVAILLTVVQSTISEMVCGRTLGKALTGCRVLDVLGSRASRRQILLRNLLKIVVLIVPPLALFVFMNPFRQRLGDLVAKTMVVVKRPSADSGSEPPPS